MTNEALFPSIAIQRLQNPSREAMRAPLRGAERPGLSGELVMPKAIESVSWDAFKWVVSGLLGVIVVLVGVGFGLLTSNVSDVKSDVREIRKDLTDSRVELAKAIGTINGRLDTLIDETRKRH